MKGKRASGGTFIALFVASLFVILILTVFVLTATMVKGWKDLFNEDSVVIERANAVGLNDVNSYLKENYYKILFMRFSEDPIIYNGYNFEFYKTLLENSQNSLGERELKSGEKSEIDIYGEWGKLEVIDIGSEIAHIRFFEEGGSVEINTQTWVPVDFEGDGVYDLKVKLIEGSEERGIVRLDIERYSYDSDEVFDGFDGVYDPVEFSEPVPGEGSLGRGVYADFLVEEGCCGEKIYWDEYISEPIRVGLKLGNPDISYSFVGCEDNPYHQENMIRAMNFLEDNVPLNFVESSVNPEITIECSDDVLSPRGENKFIAGSSDTNLIKLYTRLPSFGGVELHELLHTFGFGHYYSGDSLMNPLALGVYCVFKEGTEIFLCNADNTEIYVGKDVLDGLNSVYGGSVDES